jgi:preprotein translocase subunit SecE
MEKLTKFFNNTVEEMRFKVSWPTYGELQKSSVLVLVGSLVFAVIVGAMDLVYDSTLEWFYNQF